MATKKLTIAASITALTEFALTYPEAELGISCEGTPAEKRTVKARKKAFLFVGVDNLMFKLTDSLDEANSFAKKESARCKVGAHGWATVTLTDDNNSLELDLMKRWIDESFRALAAKALVSMLDELATQRPVKTTKIKK